MYALIELEDRDWVDIESMMEETKGVISFYPLEKDKAEKILKEMVKNKLKEAKDEMV